MKILKEFKHFKTNNGVIYNANCIDVLPKLEQDSFDMILTDPPYGIEWTCGRSKYRNYEEDIIYNDKENEIFGLFDKIIPVLSFLTKKDSEWYIFCPGYDKNAMLPKIWLYFHKVFNVSNLLIWNKKHFGFGWDWRYQYETILQIKHGEGLKPVNNYGNVISCLRKNITADNHPTEKPLCILDKIISLKQPKSILDPFFGSGSLGVVCERKNIKYVGIELNDKYYNMAVKRIKEEITQLKLLPV